MGDGGLAETNWLGEITDAGFCVDMCGDKGYQAQPSGFGDGLEHGSKRLCFCRRHHLAQDRWATLADQEWQSGPLLVLLHRRHILILS